jgi:hypothetical protein
MIGALLILVVLVLVSGSMLRKLGVELFYLTTDNGLWRLDRCGGETALTADTTPSSLWTDAQPTLIDMDMAADDWMAILYLLQ